MLTLSQKVEKTRRHCVWVPGERRVVGVSASHDPSMIHPSITTISRAVHDIAAMPRHYYRCYSTTTTTTTTSRC